MNLRLAIIALVLAVGCQPSEIPNMAIHVLKGTNRPDYYCERMDQETRTAYNCTSQGLDTILVSEYHLTLGDTWEVLAVK